MYNRQNTNYRPQRAPREQLIQRPRERAPFDPNKPENEIRVGHSSPQVYAERIGELLASGKFQDVHIRARGKSITTAIDAKEIAKHKLKMWKNLDLSETEKSFTEEVAERSFGDEDAQFTNTAKHRVSAVEITLQIRHP